MPTAPTGSGRAGALARIVGDPARFLAEHWAVEPLYRPGADPGAFADLFSLADVDHIISSSAPRLPAFRMVKDGKPLDPATYTRSARMGSKPVTGLADPGRVWDAFHGGATLVLQSVHRFWPSLARLSRELELVLTHPVQVNIYVTPPASRGLGVHHDPHDVFVLQVSGRKQWDVYSADVHKPGSDERLIGAELQPGDAMYIPQRFPHAARTAETASVHLTVGILTVTWADALRSAVATAVDEALSDQPLPAGFALTPQRWSAAVADQLAEVRRRLDKLDPGVLAERAADRFWSQRPPLLAGQLQQLLALDRVTDDTEVRRRAGAVCRVRPRADRVELLLGDRTVSLPDRARPALDTVLGSGRLAVRDLAPHLDASSRLVLVRRLIAEGLLEQVAVD
jgi:lysine-specific demethylase/histidyl-hydroxylase NO66